MWEAPNQITYVTELLIPWGYGNHHEKDVVHFLALLPRLLSVGSIIEKKENSVADNCRATKKVLSNPAEIFAQNESLMFIDNVFEEKSCACLRQFRIFIFMYDGAAASPTGI